jgi:hypothetical protein
LIISEEIKNITLIRDYTPTMRFFWCGCDYRNTFQHKKKKRVTLENIVQKFDADML